MATSWKNMEAQNRIAEEPWFNSEGSIMACASLRCSEVGVQGSKSLLSRGVGCCVFVVLKISRMRGCYAVSGRSRGVRTVRKLQRRKQWGSEWVGDRKFGFDVRDSVLLSVSLILEFDGELLCPDDHHVYRPGKIRRRFVQMS
ncbi:hypothetical protein L6452_31409 [Arctium lappa]|uniref:Uncharacterized protein n=1 Tax=Arctium lappa TaxID=4217 RepID=A0ACB8Z0X1_ARCLA|nr:hypothetical protein L6452_31409 [Arctium lappa]